MCFCVLSHSGTSDSLQPHGLWPTNSFYPQNFPGKNNTAVSCYFLFQGIFPTQGSNPHLLYLLHRQVDSLPLVSPGRLLIYTLCIYFINTLILWELAETVKNLSAMMETLVLSLGQEDPLENGRATHLQYTCLENPMDRPWGCKQSDMTAQLTLLLSNISIYVFILLKQV